MKGEYFKFDWYTARLPVKGKVAVIDHGEPAVGLSAMQLHALNIHSGIVELFFGEKKCEAKVWNASGMNYIKGEDNVRITDGVTEKLGCKKGDSIKFVKIVANTLPIKIGVIK